MKDLLPLLQFARETAIDASAVILPHYQQCSVERKADGTEVTVADREAEQRIRERIATRYPDHAVLGEEFGADPTDSAMTWIIDPIDGTTWFGLGMPLFGTLIAVAVDGDPVVGVVHFPALDETVFAARGQGCWFVPRGGEPIAVRAAGPTRLDNAFLSASGLHASDLQPAADGPRYPLRQLLELAGQFRLCSDCLQHALVCRGNLHGAIDTLMKPWDLAALVPCVEEAGGVASSLSGQRKDILNGGSLLTSCDRALHDQLVELLAT